jgi:predicted alpha/beta superfamily hydrolase
MNCERCDGSSGSSVEARQVQLPDVVGTLDILGPVASTHLGDERPILVGLPPSYSADDSGRFPVIYMHDLQNLFSDRLAFGREWRVDETLTRLAHVGLDAVVVGIPNAGEERALEYKPGASDADPAMRGDQYLRFVIEEVAPLIEERYRISTVREDTGMMARPWAD